MVGASSVVHDVGRQVQERLPTINVSMTDLDELRRRGLIRKTLRGRYSPTRRGLLYLHGVMLRDEEMRRVAADVDPWESGATKAAERLDVQVELIGRAWDRDEAVQREALEELGSSELDRDPPSP